jgi:hypothetical protein
MSCGGGEGMTIYKRICLKDLQVTDYKGNTYKIKRGNEYMTSEEENEKIFIYGQCWTYAPGKNFAIEERIT